MIFFTIDGTEYKATTAQEAADLTRALKGKSIGLVAAPGQPRPKATPKPHRFKSELDPSMRRPNGAPFDVRMATVRFLETIHHGPMSGKAANKVIREVLGAEHPKGVGQRLGKVNKHIQSLGFEVEDVYQNRRTSDGRHWSAGPKMAAARDAAQRAVG